MNKQEEAFKAFLADFSGTIEETYVRLQELEVSDEQVADKWTAKQILGHLIDSAANNHQRFVRAQFSSDLIFPGYQQDDWVAVQRYANESWDNLVLLWTSYNRHLLHVISNIPQATLTHVRSAHNLDRIAYKVVPAEQSATLEYFVRDYVDHLRHHLEQIFTPL